MQTSDNSSLSNLDVLHKNGDRESLGQALSDVCLHASSHDSEAHENILAPSHPPTASEIAESNDQHGHLHKIFKKEAAYLTQDAAYYRFGNFVIVRKTGERRWEQMPIYTRLGMHILFCGSIESSLLERGYAARLFLKETIKMGESFNAPSSKAKIPGFVKTYQLPTTDLLEPNLANYESFNDFFARKLKAGVRVPAEPEDESVLVSCADCRCVVFQNIEIATTYWIKGQHFSISNLIQDAEIAKGYEGGSIAIFRLAPQDYHRWHSPVTARIGGIKDISGTYFTVNPMAVNENLDVFTENKRSVMEQYTAFSATPVLNVAVGALLVGSINWTVPPNAGAVVKKGDELGFFAYGGSTVIAVFPADMAVRFDDDLVQNSLEKTETVIEVGNSIGKVMGLAQ